MLPKFLFAMAVAASTVMGFSLVPTQTKRAALTLNPPPEALKISSRRAPHLSQLEAKSLTNAKRMALGLPLKAPARRSPTRVLPRNQPSSTPLPLKKGVIKVLSGDGSDTLGYIAPSFNDFGEYGLMVSDPGDALVVNIDESNTITTINGPDSDFPFFGAIQGFSSSSSDLDPGSFNYLFVGGITQTFPNSTPFNGANSFTSATGLAENIESAIWTLNSDNTITASWTNSDGSVPSTTLVYAASDSLFAITGDFSEFQETFETGEEIIFSFEETA